MPSGSSLAQFLSDKRGVRNVGALPSLTISQILKWADERSQKTGEWPVINSGDVLGAHGEKWANIQAALDRGSRGLPGGSSLAQLLAKNRGYRNKKSPPKLTIKQIMKWADAHHQKFGQWPKEEYGDVLGAAGEKWGALSQSL